MARILRLPALFRESCDKCFLEEIERKDLPRFAAFLRDSKRLSPRTVHNKFADVLTFLQAQGLPKLDGKNDHPRFIDHEVNVHEDDELSELHADCSQYHSTLYDFLLMSRFREHEAMHVVWSNVRFNSNIALTLPPFLTQTVKTRSSANGEELSHWIVTQDVYQRFQAGHRATAGSGGIAGRGVAGDRGHP
ncbi:MAG: hypothetical protein ACRD19_14490 [Terriglobia bacterium]